MVAHEKRNPAQLFCAVPTQNDLALSSLLFPAQPTQKLGYPPRPTNCGKKRKVPQKNNLYYSSRGSGRVIYLSPATAGDIYFVRAVRPGII